MILAHAIAILTDLIEMFNIRQGGATQVDNPA